MAKQAEKRPAQIRRESLGKTLDRENTPDPGPKTLIESDTPSEEEIHRLTIPIDPTSGRVKWDRLRSPDKTKEAIGKLLTDPRLQVSTDAENRALNALVINVLYDAVSAVAIIVARSRGFSGSEAELLRYTEQEKAAFSAPTLKVLEKYNLLGGKYADEIMLLAAVGSVTGAHVMAMQQAHAKAAVVPMHPVGEAS